VDHVYGDDGVTSDGRRNVGAIVERLEEVAWMATVFNLREFGSAFATRERGAELRRTVLQNYADDLVLVIDFTDVTNVSYSFADEFVGRLAAESSETLSIELANMSATVQRVVRRAQERRGGVVTV
jgi:hypothetical protein